MWKVQLFKLNYDQREIDAAMNVVASGWLTMGDKVIEFEKQFSELLGGGGIHCLAVSNCTAALHMAVLAAGVSQGDEVIIPALTFVADANVVRMAGGVPVLADVSGPDDLTISAGDIERKITPKTKAVIVVHYAGYACDMDPIVDLCRRRGLVLIEDVAHAPGGQYRGKALGTFGDIGCFSFFSNKNLSIGEGGMLSFSDDRIATSLRYLRSHGMTTLTLDRHKGRAWTYDVAQPGLNYRMDEIHAALGLVQLSKLSESNRRRGELTALYRELLAHLPVHVPFGQIGDSLPTFHILPVLLEPDVDRQGVMASLKEQGIQSSIHYPPFWGFEAYSHFRPEDTPVIASLIQRELTLPLYPTMSDDEVHLVVDALRRALGADR